MCFASRPLPETAIKTGTKRRPRTPPPLALPRPSRPWPGGPSSRLSTTGLRWKGRTEWCDRAPSCGRRRHRRWPAAVTGAAAAPEVRGPQSRPCLGPFFFSFVPFCVLNIEVFQNANSGPILAEFPQKKQGFWLGHLKSYNPNISAIKFCNVPVKPVKLQYAPLERNQKRGVLCTVMEPWSV